MYSNLAQELFNNLPICNRGNFPSTRYQGSKNKIVKWIDYWTKDLKFNSVIDAFGGTGCVGYMFKNRRKQVFYNDILKFNYYIGLALIENSSTLLDVNDIDSILTKHKNIDYPDFVTRNFQDIYFTNDENKWLDFVITNIKLIDNKYKQALAYYALFQSCIIKRPYNLFHRKNLYIRNADVKRSFGNKTTWDASFDFYFKKFAREGNKAVFSNACNNVVSNSDVFDLKVKADLVYIDTPYISSKGTGVNYIDFYHFLEGIVLYDQWENLIDEKSQHKKIKNMKNVWCRAKDIQNAFDIIFEKFKDSIIVLSYRDDGIPTIDNL
ncbi:MAG: DNA adenine methylase, partial [Endomicrobium sp.]|uniref:DNA adenine methylase n=1 Tax=Candidatus Endomicrobiellum pyrsonymphae TaxID=1408203 RepID=UPI00357EEE73|nr:DNA adenine methylase [Endomicrobium sp.]